MIFDETANYILYCPLSKSFKVSFEFFLERKFTFENPHVYEIGNEGIYAIPQNYSPKKKEEKTIEAHHRFIDIQFMVEGKEYLGYGNKNDLSFNGYNKEQDTEILTGNITFLPFHEGQFAILFPQDAHMPGVKFPRSIKTVKKLVIKVPVELWEKMVEI